MGFKPPTNKGEKRRKAPPLPPRDDISEDSLEDQVSDLDDSYQKPRQVVPRESKIIKRTIDVDTILKNATDGLDDSGSIASSAFAPMHGDNKLPLPDPLDRNIMINDNYLNKFKHLPENPDYMF